MHDVMSLEFKPPQPDEIVNWFPHKGIITIENRDENREIISKRIIDEDGTPEERLFYANVADNTIYTDRHIYTEQAMNTDIEQCKAEFIKDKMELEREMAEMVKAFLRKHERIQVLTSSFAKNIKNFQVGEDKFMYSFKIEKRHP